MLKCSTVETMAFCSLWNRLVFRWLTRGKVQKRHLTVAYHQRQTLKLEMVEIRSASNYSLPFKTVFWIRWFSSKVCASVTLQNRSAPCRPGPAVLDLLIVSWISWSIYLSIDHQWRQSFRLHLTRHQLLPKNVNIFNLKLITYFDALMHKKILDMILKWYI